MRVADAYRSGKPAFSFEFFPPKTPEAVARLRETVKELRALGPSFVSVTYGAGGSTRELTIELVTEIKHELGVEAMAHLTCVGHDAPEIAAILDRLRDAGIENVLALRGDPPRGQTEFHQPEGGFGHGSELAAFVRSGGWDFCVGGACYPEGHVESADREQDVRFAKAKEEAGSAFLISQLFFEAPLFFEFVRKARLAGVSIPIVPGIMPVTNVAQIERFTKLCGATIPAELRARLADAGEDDAAVVAVGIEWATEQSLALLRGGAPGIHFYTLNRSHSTMFVFERLKAAAPELVSP